MKIVYVINSLGAGGAERHALDLARYMVQRGCSVWVAVLSRKISGGAKDLEEDFVGAGIRVIHLASYALGDIGRWGSLVALLNELRPDIVHSHLPRSDMTAAIAKAVFPKTLWVSTIHDAYTRDKYSGHWIFPLVGWNWRRADHIVAVSNRAREWSMTALAIPPGKISVVYHGVRARGSDGACRGGATRPPTIGCLARFEKRKGIETLVQAMAEVRRSIPDAQLLLAGSDPTGYAAVIENLAKSLGVDRSVKLLGFCAAPIDFLRNLDVFAFASRSEGFGIVLLEAMSVGRAIVASDIYPINHIVQHGRTGLLVRPDDAHAFATAIVDLLGDPARRESMGKAGLQRCVEEFSQEESLGRIHGVYTELLARQFPLVGESAR